MNDQDTNSGWFSSDFSSFFKNCGCGGRDDKESQSSNMSRRKLLPVENNNEGENDNRSTISNQDWVDLEDFPVFNPEDAQLGNGLDEYETKDPMNFDQLMRLTGAHEDEERRSQHSSLSADSKKIKKTKAGNKKEGSVKGSAAKGAKGKGKRNPWQPHENARLIELVNKHGQSWALIASMMEGRTGKQVRDRYLNILRPNIKKGDWTPQEDQHILSLYYQFGHKWSKISSFVPGRTEGQVKNRFYAHIKKKILNNENSDQNASPGNGIPNGHYHPTPESLTPTTSQNLGYFPPSPQTSNDPADTMISYNEDYSKVPRNGSNEVFLQSQPSPSNKSMGSLRTTYTAQTNTIRDEKDVAEVLDKIALFFEKSSNSPNQEGRPIYQAEPSATQKLEEFEHLKRIQESLQFLLSQTNTQMSSFQQQF